MAGTRRSEIEAPTEQLFNAAAVLFQQHGYGWASLDAIAHEARVAVHTIYLKFGGKLGLLTALVERSHQRYRDLLIPHDVDTRTIEQILSDFDTRFVELVHSPESIALQRAVIAEAATQPELARAFYDSGMMVTRELLWQFFAASEIRKQLHEDVDCSVLPTQLINCILGDHFRRFLMSAEALQEEIREPGLEGRLKFFYRLPEIIPVIGTA